MKKSKSGQDYLSLEADQGGASVFLLHHFHEVIDGATRSDLEVLCELQQAIQLKVEEIKEEIERDRQMQAEDWLPNVQNVDDQPFLCGCGTGLDDWWTGPKLGEGAFATVYATTHKISGTKGAVKVISKSIFNGDQYDCLDARSELACLLKLPKHESIAGLLDALQSTQSLYFFQEFAKGKDLFDFIKLRQPSRWREATAISPEAISQIFSDVTSGLACCHHHGMCHRDVKPENIIVNQDYSAKLVDFGCACARMELRKQCVGSMPFIAPECLLGTARDGAPADVWTVGIVLMEMMFGLKALSKALGWDTCATSTQDRGAQLMERFADSYQGITFVRAALGISSVFHQGEKVLTSVLQIDPQKRPAMEILQTALQ
jgi:serine/threonine protein kinase